MKIDDLILVSVDDHVVEPPDLFEGHLPEKWQEVAPRMVRRDDGSDVWLYEGKEIVNIGLNDLGVVKTKVPSLLGVGARAPFMHTGCAKTLADRFDPANVACNGGDNHGKTSQLDPTQTSDLIAYLETL